MVVHVELHPNPNPNPTLFDAHIRLIFSRQYHINCLSILNNVLSYMHIFSIFNLKGI